MSIQRFTKQPGETLDYDFDFTKWFGKRTDTIDSYTVAVSSGITKVGDTRTGKVIKVVLSGGTDGQSYLVTVKITTTSTPALVKEHEILVKVKETA